MSHLFKNDLSIFFKIFKVIIIIIILTLYLYGFNNYQGSKILYSIFSVVSNYLIFFAFRKKAIFFETFFSLLLWLGFWFKFTCTIAFTTGQFKEGVGLFDYSKTLFNESLIVSIIGISAFIFSGHFREFFLFNYPKKLENTSFKNNFFCLGQKKIWIIFFILFIIVGILNFYFKIYQKGLLPIYDINFIISGIFKWLLLFGLSSISAVLIFYEYNYFKKFFLLTTLIVIFETFITSIFMLSRGMIFNCCALLFGIYKFSNKHGTPNNLGYYLKSFSLIIVLFYISVSSVNYLRANYFYVGKSAEYSKILNKEKEIKTVTETETKKFTSLNENNSEIFYLLINRWVGIDGVMAVVSKKDLLNVAFLVSAFKERPKVDSPTFYELTFGLESMNSYTNENKLYENVKGNTLPGVVAFFYYSGSYLILFIIIFFICVLAAYLEFISFKLSSKNLIFSALIGQVIAFRFIHFGYLPHQSYLLFGTILLTIIFTYLLSVLLKRI